MDLLSSLLNRFEPPLPTLEDDYRQHYLSADMAQAIIVSQIVLASTIVFIPSDYWLFYPQPLFFGLLALRGFFGLLTLLFAFSLRRVTRPGLYDQLTFVWTIVTLLFTVLVDATRPPTYLGRYLLHVMYVFLIYLALPNGLIYRAGAALVFSLVSLASLVTLVAESAPLFVVAAVFVLLIANLVGFLTSTRSNSYRRRQYSAMREADRLNAELTVLAETDSLTGALNRRKLLALASEEYRRFRRYGRPFSVAVMDLDFFKRVNDNHGHQIGDQVLAEFGRLALAEKRNTDRLGRLGGEEFALLLPETTEALAYHLGERLRQQLECSDSIRALVGYPVTLSIGIATVADTETGFGDLLRRADAALYRAKQNGRNRVEQ